MTRTMRLLASASVLAVAALAASPASATGTAAGTSVTNTVTVGYSVNSVAQNNVTASDTFLVDRKIDLTVAGGATTTVTPGQTAQAITFTVTNSSNAPLDFGLSVAAQQVGGVSAHGGTDTFDVTNVKIYVDSNGNGVFDSASDALLNYLDEVPADTTRTVFIVADIPTGKVNGDVADLRLVAQAREAGGVGSQGIVVTQTAGANGNNTVDTVFADQSTANGNVAKDGIMFADNDFTIGGLGVTATKTSKIISDPFSASNPKMIPGATVEYCIVVSNAAGAKDATNVGISDTLPAQTTYVPGSLLVNATVTGGVCSGGVAGGSESGGTPDVISYTIGGLTNGSSTGIVYRVTVK